MMGRYTVLAGITAVLMLVSASFAQGPSIVVEDGETLKTLGADEVLAPGADYWADLTYCHEMNDYYPLIGAVGVGQEAPSPWSAGSNSIKVTGQSWYGGGKAGFVCADPYGGGEPSPPNGLDWSPSGAGYQPYATWDLATYIPGDDTGWSLTQHYLKWKIMLYSANDDATWYPPPGEPGAKRHGVGWELYGGKYSRDSGYSLPVLLSFNEWHQVHIECDVHGRAIMYDEATGRGSTIDGYVVNVRDLGNSLAPVLLEDYDPDNPDHVVLDKLDMIARGTYDAESPDSYGYSDDRYDALWENLDHWRFTMDYSYPNKDPSGTYDFWIDDVTLTGAIPGDANGDGVVDQSDFTILAINYEQSGTWGWADGDFNGDGLVNQSDFTVLAINYTGNEPLGTVPEPASAMLLIGGLVAAARRRM